PAVARGCQGRRHRFPSTSKALVWYPADASKSMRVIRTSAFRAAIAAGLGLLLTGSFATAKPGHCRKDCKQDIEHCRALVPTNADCAGTKAERRACRTMHAAQGRACQGLVKLCRRLNPNISGICL